MVFGRTLYISLYLYLFLTSYLSNGSIDFVSYISFFLSGHTSFKWQCLQVQEMRSVPAHRLRRLRFLPRHGQVRRARARQADLHYEAVLTGSFTVSAVCLYVNVSLHLTLKPPKPQKSDSLILTHCTCKREVRVRFSAEKVTVKVYFMTFMNPCH